MCNATTLLRRAGFAAGQVQSTMGTVPLAEVREAGRAGPLMLFQARARTTLLHAQPMALHSM